jgi:DNA polymerase I
MQGILPFAELGRYSVVSSYEEAVALSNALMRLDAVALDTETTGLGHMTDTIVVFSLSDGVNRWAVPLQYLGCFQPLFENPASIKICHNIKFDAHMLRNHGIVLSGPWHDTMTMSWLVDENLPLSLKDRFSIEFDCHMPDFEEIFGRLHTITEQVASNSIVKRRSKQRKETLPEAFARVLNEDPELAYNYASADAKMHYMLWDRYRWTLNSLQFTENFTAWQHFVTVEVPFTRTLWNMETRGFRINRKNLLTAEPILHSMMNDIAQEFHRLAGPVIEEYNRTCPAAERIKPYVDIDSPKQVGDFLYGVLGYPQSEGKRTTDEQALEHFIETKDCPYSSVVLQFREVSKLKRTYIDKLLGLIWVDGKIHTTLKQTGTVTGRLSSADPNLQNIPRPDNDRSNIRATFIASPHHRLIVGDYAQLEMRIMAHYSKDQGMLDAILSGKDLHTYTAARMFGYTYDDLVLLTKQAKEAMHKSQATDEHKRIIGLRIAAKRINFGIIYGMGPKGLMVQLAKEGVHRTLQECKMLLKQYFATFPDVAVWINGTHEIAAGLGYVRTISGRMRRLPSFRDKNSDHATISRAERQAVNTPIQGTAADITKNAMISCEHDDVLRDLQVRLVLQVHDELVFECPDHDDVANIAVPRIRHWMENPLSRGLIVPLEVDLNQGYSWAEAK